MTKKADPLRQADPRTRLEQAAITICRPQEPRYKRIEALGTLLSAYALGSRTAKRGLMEYQERFPGWTIPSKDDAIVLANEAFSEAEALEAAHRAGDTRPGY